jgi:chitin disaccharide deacetylase
MPGVRLAVCADDYGLSAGVDEAIADLVESHRLSALSCLVDAPHFHEGAARLPALAARADVGLHLNFTESFGEPAPRYPLATFIARAYARRLDRAAIRAEIRRQLDVFEAICGFAPHHVDGHQHVQQLPIVREALLEELAARGPRQRPWLRIGVPLPGAHGVKPMVLGALGARALERDARQRGFATNAHLLGVYGFDGSAADYLARLERWLAAVGDRDLLMTHPGGGERKGDPIAAARSREYGVLAGAAFAQMLAAHGVTVARLSTAA